MMARGLMLAGVMIATGAAAPASEIRIGIIGLDTSHVVAFTKILNDPKDPDHVPGARVVAGYPGGSPDVAASRTRVKGFTAALAGMGVTIVDRIDALLPRVDAVMIESVDGRPHLEQVRPVLRARKRVFIDKPAAGSLHDVIEIDRLAHAAGVPWFSSSSLRFAPAVRAVRRDPRLGAITGCLAFSPCPLEPHHPDLYWYGVHGVEMVYTIMGTGCRSVVRTHTAGVDVVTGVWPGGRVATFRGIRQGHAGYGALVFGTKANRAIDVAAGYRPLVVEIVRFFRTGVAPVKPEETVELFAFMTAADQSKDRGGVPVSLESVLKAAASDRVPSPRPAR